MTQPRLNRLTLALVATLLWLTGCQPPPAQQLLHDTTYNSILPAYQHFADTSTALENSATTFCRDGGEAGFVSVQERWRESASAWAAIQSLQFGPVLEDNQAWKIQFWPDRKNLVARKVESLLGSSDTIDAARVEKASVVLQGLSGLEYLLFDPRSNSHNAYTGTAGQRRCELLRATSSHLRGVAEFLNTSWRPEGGNYAATFSQPEEDNSDFPDHNAAIGTLIDSLVYGLELVKRDKLERPLGIGGGGAQIYLLEWWRARHSVAAITANLAALQNLYQADKGYGLDDYLVQQGGKTELAAEIGRRFDELRSLGGKLQAGLFDQAGEASTLAATTALTTRVAELESLLKNEVPAALGITLSFNSNDGD